MAADSSCIPISAAWNWRRALIQSDLSSTTKHVMLTLACHVSEAGYGCFPSMKTLSEETSLTRDTVKRHLRLAEKKGWVQREDQFTENGRQTSNSYALAAPVLEGVSKEGGGQETPQGGGQETHQGRGVLNTPPIPLKGSEVKAHGNGGGNGELFPSPVKGRKGKKKAISLPANWKPSEAHRERAARDGLDLDLEVEKMRNNAEANGRTQVNWNAFFSNWLINAKIFANRDNGNGDGGKHWAEE